MQPQSDSSAVRLSSSPRKLCVVFHCRQYNSEEYEFNFYILDCDSFPCNGGEEYPRLKPTIRFKGSRSESHTVAFCALNSTLYMFEGDDEARRKRRAGRFAGKFVLTPDTLAGLNNYVIERNDLVSIKPMNQTKICPKAVPSPDGKSILVFSTEFFYVEPGCYDDSFELYDVGEDLWRALPRLPSTRPPPCHSHRYAIEAYGFESNSRFVILMEDAKKFVLNLQTLQWERDLDFHAPIYELRDYFFGIDGFYFDRYEIYDSRAGYGPFWFDRPLSSLPYHHHGHHCRSHRGIALLGDEYDGAYDIGVVQAEEPSEYHDNNSLHMILNTYRVDFVQFRRDYEIYKRDMEKYMGKVLVSLPDMPSLNTTACKTVEQLERDFYKYKRNMKKYFKRLNKTYRGKGLLSPPDKPSLKTTVSKTLKLQFELLVDFDFKNDIYTTMYEFPI